MSDEDVPNLWIGHCEQCDANFTLDDSAVAEHPDTLIEGVFLAKCSTCGFLVEMERQNVKVIPFSSWQMLPPAEGLCPECGVKHEPGLPHNPQSLTYQYSFRLGEAKAGREERWPTWADAMAHCAPEVQQQWIAALAEHGVIV